MLRKYITRFIGFPFYDYTKGLRVRDYLKFYKSTLAWSREQIEEYQFNQLKKLIRHAYENVFFYRKRFEQHSFKPDAFKSFEDLTKIPPLTREDLQNNLAELISQNVDFNKCHKGSSSGSTGQPVIYYHDSNSTSAGHAAGYLGWFLAGWEPGDKRLYIWGNPRVVNVEWKRLSSKLKGRLFNMEKFPAYQLTEGNKFDELVKLIRKNNFTFIEGYTNAIYFLAKYIRENNIKLHKFDYILTTAENLHKYQRTLIEDVLGPVYDGYGCGEINGIAYECKNCKKYHIIEPHVFVEFDEEVIGDDGSRALIITDLNNFVMPLIRYKNGDLAIPENTNNCKIKFKKILSISGRISDIIDLPNGGKLMVPSFFGSMLLKQIKGLTHYQIEKVAPNKIIIKLVVKNDFSEDDKQKIEQSLQEYLKDKIEWQIKFVDKIPVSKSGKYKLLVDKTQIEN